MNNFKTYWIFFPFILLTCFRTSESAEITSSPNKEDASYLKWGKKVSESNHHFVLHCTNFLNYWCVSSHLSNLKFPSKWMAKGSFRQAVYKRILTFLKELGSPSLSSAIHRVSLTMSSWHLCFRNSYFLLARPKLVRLITPVCKNLIVISRCDQSTTYKFLVDPPPPSDFTRNLQSRSELTVFQTFPGFRVWGYSEIQLVQYWNNFIWNSLY